MLVFSTHAFTEGDVLSSFFGWLYAISTHAFTEGDISAPRVLEYECISTHAFTEGDPIVAVEPFLTIRFQLTPSRKATSFPVFGEDVGHFISTHAFTEGDAQGR